MPAANWISMDTASSSFVGTRRCFDIKIMTMKTARKPFLAFFLSVYFLLDPKLF